MLIVHWTPAGEGKVAQFPGVPNRHGPAQDSSHHTESKTLMPAAHVKPSENKKLSANFMDQDVPDCSAN
jgi:hypothetical protein